ncbi:hypothetical protein Tco_1142034 [Tanacetum coccineum]
MELYTKLQQRVLTLEETKTTQAQEITSLKLRVKKLEKGKMSRTYKLKRLYKVGSSRRVESSEDEGLGEEDASKQGRKIADIDADAGVTLDSTHFDTDTDMFGVHDLDGDEVIIDNVEVVKTIDPVTIVGEVVTTARVEVSTATTILVSAAVITDVETTLAQALAELKSRKPKTTTTITTTAATTITAASTRPKAKGIVVQEPSESISTISLQQGSKDKGKAKMIESEEPKKKRDQIKFDEELAFNLQAEEEERLTREEAQQVEEANISWDNVQAMIDADYQIAQRLQVQE